MPDVYHLKKGGNQKKRLLTSHDDQTKLKINGKHMRLVQDASVQYNQRTEARFEVGFEKIYWAAGQSQGTMTLNKLVGQDSIGNNVGLWEGIVDEMGSLGKEGANIKFRLNTENGRLKGDGIFQQATASFNVGNMSIQDNAVMAVGNLEKG